MIRAALRHPFALTLLIASLLLAVATRFLPELHSWWHLAPWLLLWGLLAYVVSVLAVHRWQPEPSEQELRELRSIRRLMEVKLSEHTAAQGSHPSELNRILAEAIAHLDKKVEPALRQILERQGDLGKLLARYDSGDLPLPEAAILERLRGIHARQRAAIEECVQQASNAAGTLIALLQEGDDASIAGQARTWAKDLLNLYDTIAEVLRGEAEQEELDSLYERAAANPSASVPSHNPRSDGLESDAKSFGDFSSLTQEALRQLNNPGALSRCDLAYRLAGTLAAARSQSNDGVMADLTPLDQAQALRESLVSAIDRLKPQNETTRAGDPGAIQYHILHEEYVLKRPTAHIMMRHSIAETTFYRHRRDAIAAVADQLETQEQLIEGGQSQ